MSLKSFLPYESYTLASKLTVDEVRKRIKDNLETIEPFSPRKPYMGWILGYKFRIRSITRNRRNSFLPKIFGHISYTGQQTIIRIKMRPMIFVLVFMTIWLGGMATVFIFLVIAKLFLETGPDEHPVFGIFISSGMFLAGWSLMYFGFKSESAKSKKFLASLLEGNEIK